MIDFVRFENHGSRSTICPEASNVDRRVRSGGGESYVARQVRFIQEIGGRKSAITRKALEITRLLLRRERRRVRIGGQDE